MILSRLKILFLLGAGQPILRLKSEYAYLFSGIKNADDITAGKKAPSTLGVKAEGNYKLVVTMERRFLISVL